jgi:histidine triad (HIT) family protein
MQNSETIFDKILSGAIPAKKVLENDFCLAFHDISPQAPIHVLIIPKTKLKNISEATSEHVPVLGRILEMAGLVAHHLKVIESGYRLIINNGRDAGQSVDYIHCHLLAGRPLCFPIA